MSEWAALFALDRGIRVTPLVTHLLTSNKNKAKITMYLLLINYYPHSLEISYLSSSNQRFWIPKLGCIIMFLFHLIITGLTLVNDLVMCFTDQSLFHLLF